MDQTLVIALSPCIICKLHLVILFLSYLRKLSDIVIGEQVDSIFSQAVLGFNDDVKLYQGVSDWIGSRYGIEIAEQ